jgi:tetratricopeptide (TPR) repeat protein
LQTWFSVVLFKIPIRFALFAVVIAGILGAYFVQRYYFLRPSRLLTQGHQAIETGDFGEVGRLVDLLEDQEDYQAAHLLRGEALVYAAEAALKTEKSGSANQGSPSQGLLRKALTELDKIQDHEPLGIKAMFLKAECLVYLQQQGEAEKKLRQVIEHDQDDREAHRLLAAVYVDLNSPKEAIEQFEHWARLDPSNGLPYRWIGFYKKDYYRVEEAIAAYEEALQRNLAVDNRAAVLKELAQCFCVGEGEFQKALDVLDGHPELSQDDLSVMGLRAECLRNLPGRESDAVKILEQGLKLSPDNPPFLMMRAQIFLAEDKPGQALPLLERAVQLDPHDLKIRTLLIDAYKSLKNDAQAEKQKEWLEATQKTRMKLSRLIQEASHEPRNDRIRVEIASLCMEVNNHDLARTWLRAALACNPNNAQARELLNRLSERVGNKSRK